MAEVAYERENKRASGVSCGNHLDIDWRQMKGFDIKGFNARNKAFWRVEKIHRHGIAKGVDCTAARFRTQWAAPSQSVC